MPPQLQWACSAQVQSPTTKVCPPSAFWTGGCCLCDPSHSGMGGAHLCHVDPLTETCRRGSGPMSPSAQSLILAAIAYCRCKFWTFYHHKIVLNHRIVLCLMAFY